MHSLLAVYEFQEARKKKKKKTKKKKVMKTLIRKITVIKEYVYVTTCVHNGL